MQPDPMYMGLRRDQRRTLIAMVSAAFAFGAGLSLGLPLLSLVAEQRGVSSTWIGINTAMAGIAAFLVPPWVTPVARRFGAASVLIVALIVTAICFVAFYLIEPFWIWFPLRIVFHGGLAFVFVLTEFWINALAPPEKRGFVMGIYATLLAAGFSVGPLLLALAGSEGIMPFLIGALVILISIVPIALTRDTTPDMQDPPKQSILGFVFAVPVATFAPLIFGAVESGVMAILPLYGLRIGLSVQEAAIMVTAVAAGNIVLQIPIGLLSDRMDKVLLLILCGIAGIVGAAVVPFIAANFWLTLAVLFVWGGITAGLYTVGLTHLGANFSGSSLATANATLAMMYGTGMMIGPPAMGIGLDVAPPHGPMWVMAVLFAIYVVVAWLTSRRTGKPQAASSTAT